MWGVPARRGFVQRSERCRKTLHIAAILRLAHHVQRSSRRCPEAPMLKVTQYWGARAITQAATRAHRALPVTGQRRPSWLSMSALWRAITCSARTTSYRSLARPCRRKRLYHASHRLLAAAPAASQSSVNSDEIALFSRLSSQWWDERGEFQMLHKMNPVRVQFIREKLVCATPCLAVYPLTSEARSSRCGENMART